MKHLIAKKMKVDSHVFSPCVILPKNHNLIEPGLH